MLIRHAAIKDISWILKLVCQGEYKYNFYSDCEGSIVSSMLLKRCYVIYSKKNIMGVILVNKVKGTVLFLPASGCSISFFRLIYILKKELELSGYTITINYKKINLENLKKYFSFYVVKDLKLMNLNLRGFKYIDSKYDNIKVRKISMVDKNEALLRVELQNEIFGHIIGRSELTLNEVLEESKELGFLKDLCFVIEISNIPVGYGQIIRINGNYSLVNLGIIPSHRGLGLSFILINEILRECKSLGITDIHLTVDSNNIPAITLYEKVGFKEINNKLTLIL